MATEPATIPADIPYIAPPDETIAAWRERLPQGRPRVGLAWSGDRSHDNDLNRSLGLETLAPLLDVPDVIFVSLQNEIRERDLPILEKFPKLVRTDLKFRDFADTAAVISLMDTVISVDTAVAHLTGAMGKPLFLLLPFAADFRWLRSGQDSPWYPTAQLYRQAKFGNWESTVAAVRNDLLRYGCRRQGIGAVSTEHKLSA